MTSLDLPRAFYSEKNYNKNCFPLFRTPTHPTPHPKAPKNYNHRHPEFKTHIFGQFYNRKKKKKNKREIECIKKNEEGKTRNKKGSSDVDGTTSETKERITESSAAIPIFSFYFFFFEGGEEEGRRGISSLLSSSLP